LYEHPALVKLRPEVCLRQIEDGLKIAAEKLNALFSEIIAVGLDTPGPASAAGLLSPKVSTNFIHPKWAGCDIREGFASVTYVFSTALNIPTPPPPPFNRFFYGYSRADLNPGANLVLGAGRCEFNSPVFIDLAELAFLFIRVADDWSACAEEHIGPIPTDSKFPVC
jgi:hypothetical protein